MTAFLSRRRLLGMPPLLFAAGAVAPLSLTAQPAPPAARTDAPGLIRLAANENPAGPGPAARAALAAATGDAWKYPMGEAMALRAMIAEREGLTPGHVLITDGSTEVLHIAALLAGAGGGELLTCAPTFDYAASQVRAIGGTVRELPLDAAMRFDLAALRAAVAPATRLVYLCNPNNPTGTWLPGSELRAFIAAMPAAVTVLVDEAYLELATDMATHSMVDRVRAGDSLVVARTFSKLHGLAGLRIGYALARPDLIERMGRLKLVVPSGPGLAAATASYRDFGFQAASRREIAEGVAITTAALAALGRPQAETRANFVFFDTGGPAPAFMAAMRQRGFSLGRPYASHPTWCRVSMGTVAQMRQFAGALQAHYG